MWYKIKQGRHRAYPLSLGIHTGKTEQRLEVIFDESCRYSLEGEDQLDWNKLYGWSYGLHHSNSIRIGWRYNEFQEMIEVVLYLYKDGKRIDTDNLTTTFVPLNTKLEFHLILLGSNKFPSLGIYNGALTYIYRTMYDMSDYNRNKLPEYKPTWGYELNPYFGGTLPNPNEEMKIWLRKLN